MGWRGGLSSLANSMLGVADLDFHRRSSAEELVGTREPERASTSDGGLPPGARGVLCRDPSRLLELRALSAARAARRGIAIDAARA